jgi:hypothetical protein
MTLGDVQQSRQLSSWEIASFLLYHPIATSRIALFNLMVYTVGFDQVYTPPETLRLAGYTIPLEWDINILPPSGLCIADSTLGNVLVAPNSSGSLYYTAFADTSHCSAAQKVDDQGGAYAGPQPSDPNDPNCDWLCQAGKAVDTAWFVVVGIGFMYAYNTFHKNRG